MRKTTYIIIMYLFPILCNAAEWEVIGNMPKTVAGGQAIVHDSLIYILGGKQHPGMQQEGSTIVQVFNPKDNSWEIKNGLLEKRYGFVAGYYQNEVLSCGGIFRPLQEQKSLESWDFVNPPKIIDNQANFSRMFATGHIYGDDFFLIGGIAVTYFDPTSTSYIIKYNIPSTTITKVYEGQFSDEYPFQQMSVLHEDDIYILGGVSFNISNKVSKLNCSSHEYKQVQPNLLHERAGGAAVLTESNDIYVIGGISETDLSLSSVEIYHLSYNDSANSITTGPSLNNGRRELMAVYFDNAIYVFGGTSKFGMSTSSVEKLTFESNRVTSDDPTIINNFTLADNYPNPFRGYSANITTISFKLERSTSVRLDIYSILGKHIKTLKNEELVPGEYRVTWDGTDNNNLPAASGVYIYRLTTDYISLSKKMILSR